METSKVVALFVGFVVFALPVALVVGTSPDGPERRTGVPVAGTVPGLEENGGVPADLTVPSTQALEDAASRPLRRVARGGADAESRKEAKAGARVGKGTERAERQAAKAQRAARKAQAAAARKAQRQRNGLAAHAVEGALFDASGKRHLAPREVAFLLRDVGFPVEHIPRMVCTAKWESLYDTHAKNVNRHNGSHDTGLFQINDIWLSECGVTRQQLLDPAVNAACAKKVFREHGYWAWYGYRYKQEECKKFKLSDRTMVRLSAR